MKRILFAFIVSNGMIVASCNSSTESSKTNSVATDSTSIRKVKYTCTMHPEIISDTAGQCPKCGMDLVPIKDSTRKK